MSPLRGCMCLMNCDITTGIQLSAYGTLNRQHQYFLQFNTLELYLIESLSRFWNIVKIG